MASKTRSRQKISLKAGKRQKEKKQKWLNLIDNAAPVTSSLTTRWSRGVMPGYPNSHEYSDFESSSFGYYRYNIKTNQPHEWVEKNSSLTKIVFQCALCEVIAVGKPRDDYVPPVYDHYMRTEEEANMSCAERCAKDIIE